MQYVHQTTPMSRHEAFHEVRDVGSRGEDGRERGRGWMDWRVFDGFL